MLANLHQLTIGRDIYPGRVDINQAIKQLTKGGLTYGVDTLQTDVSGLTTKNSDSHARLWAKNEEQDKTIDEHEKRIGRLENHKV